MKAWILILWAVLLALPASALNIGVSPGSLSYSRMLKGGYAEKQVVVSASIDRNLSVEYSVTGEIAAWVHPLDNRTFFNVSDAASYTFVLVVEPPADTPTGNYSGTVSFVTGTIAGITAGAGSSVRAGVAVLVSVEVIGDEVRSCVAEKMRIITTEIESPLEFFGTVSNTGNVRSRPTVEIGVWDQRQDKLLRTYTFQTQELLPTRTEMISNRLDNQFGVGQYWVDITIRDCEAADLQTFSVVEKGAVSDEGSLDGIFSKPWYYVGDYVDVNAVFINQGSRSVLAKFKGQVTFENKVVELLESDETLVGPQQKQQFIMFFTPRWNGTYSVRGRVTYNNKLTFEKGTLLRVAPKQGQTPVVPFLLYLALIALIVFFIVKIRQERHRI